MPQRHNFAIDWWQLAADKSPTAIAFVGVDDRFNYCNQAWCELVGWSESELLEKRWQDITLAGDVGGDQGETGAVKDGDKSEYYLEKQYKRKDGRQVPIGLYVHRFPSYGPHEGYVVFASELGSAELRQLRAEFEELQALVAELKAGRLKLGQVEHKLATQGKELKNLWSLMQGISSKSPTITVGDQTGGDRTGRDKISNDTKIIVVVAVVLCATLLGTVALFLGGQLEWRGGGQQIEINSIEE